MIIRRVNKQDIDEALAEVNKRYDDNIVYRREPEFMSRSRGGGNSYRLTLTVKDSAGPGGRRSHSGRRVAAACWHVHGYFFDALPEQAIIVANGVKKRPGDQWEDRNIGSYFYPMYYSEACEC